MPGGVGESERREIGTPSTRDAKWGCTARAQPRTRTVARRTKQAYEEFLDVKLKYNRSTNKADDVRNVKEAQATTESLRIPNDEARPGTRNGALPSPWWCCSEGSCLWPRVLMNRSHCYTGQQSIRDASSQQSGEVCMSFNPACF